MRGYLKDQRTLGIEEAEEGGEEPRRDRRGTALYENAIGAPTMEFKAPYKVIISELVAGLH
ncbi:uncharacterized protein N7529_001028 [Penicillium soppii]|uniref:uncharacterized protein n=1 Tax=Penicillium soppii TaxID=69789 RepID=UPI0025498A2E|nr:uncharacterized protein N7529_001028 [Penicillium soppii]KAJ5882356.1 hypothetical protein N7529_001028 [Penicillium soppii]